MTINRQIILSAIILSFVIVGCTSQDDIPEIVPPTVQWSEAEEINHWIFNQMEHYYLWNEDLPDSISCDFNATPKVFFESLLSSKDRFSYITAKSSDRSEENRSVGFAYQPYVTNDGQLLWEILYITSQSAKDAGLKRGDFVKPVSTSANKIQLLKVVFNDNHLAFNGTIEYFFSESRAKLNETVQLDSVFTIDGNRIGYLCYLEYNNPSDFFDSFAKFANNQITTLILDLRYNPGGLVSTCKKLCNLIIPSSAYNKLFQQCSYNNIIAAENFRLSGDERTYSYFGAPVTSGAVMGEQYSYLNLSNIYVLTSKYTASASESTISSLRPYMDVTVIGENSVGKGVGMQTLTSSKYKYALVPITFRFYNAIGETIPDDGIVPDYYVPDGNNTPKRELGDLSEPLLAKAIELIVGKSPIEINRSNIYYENNLTPVGEPSYITDYKNKHYNESN